MRRLDQYEPVIGLEVHCQLQTASKVFSPDSAAFGGDPNAHVDPVSLGHPGTLPVLNGRAVRFAVRMGLATHCRIAPRSVLARKHYFYPDLSKGYQISQYETPLCSGGYVDLDEEALPGEQPRRVGLTRIHLEEDAGKSLHDQDPYETLIDYNRCGVPLIEIVTEPDLRAPVEAAQFVRQIRQLVRYLEICDGNMEEGSLRCDANVSVRRRGQTTFGTKAEVKNMNSVRSVERALDYEVHRQVALLERGEAVVQETRLWDADRLETRPMRSKEEAHDYRYLPDPDLVPIALGREVLASIRAELPELPAERRRRFVEELGLPPYDAGVLTEERAVAEYYDAALSALFKRTGGGDTRAQAKALSNVVMTEVLRALPEHGGALEAFPLTSDRLAGLVALRLGDALSSSGAQDLFEVMLGEDGEAEALARRHNLLQVSDAGALAPVVEEVVAAHPEQVAQYHDGNQKLVGYFIGRVMKAFDGSPDPKLVRRLLLEALDRRS